MENPVNRDLKTSTFLRNTAISGLVGCFSILICAVLAMLPYIGKDGESYSLFNHFISELGHRKISAGAAYFNYGMIVSSSMMLLFGWGLTGMYQGWLRFSLRILAITTGISCAFVGVFPMDNLEPHLLAATVFFHSALLMVLFCSAVTLFSKPSVLPKWSILPGTLTGLTFLTFVLWPKDLVRSWARNPTAFVRPDFWWLTVWEWACFFSILLWIMLICIWVIQKHATPRT